jgi:hypothetical protein
LGGQFQPFAQPLSLLLDLDGARIDGRQRHAGLAGQDLDGLRERQPLGFLEEGDEIAGLARREVEELALVVVDVEGRGLFLGEGRQADELAPLLAQLHRSPDHVGWAEARFDLIQETFVEPHGDELKPQGAALRHGRLASGQGWEHFRDRRRP